MTFKIVLMLEAMGMNLLTKYNATPTTTKITTRFSKGIFWVLLQQGVAIGCPLRREPIGLGLTKLCLFGTVRYASA
jgi:hypothetical protein